MTNLVHLSDSELLGETKKRVAREKEITLEILHHLREIEIRKLFLARGFSSLFDFCTKELGYSEGAANRRISSMRLLTQLPEVETKIKENKVNLSTLTQFHSYLRKEEKVNKVKISKEEKLKLLGQIEGLSQNDCQRELLKFSSQPEVHLERERALSAELTEIKFIASQELMEKLKRLKDLTAHKNPDPSWSELFETLADMALKKLDLHQSVERPKVTAAAAKRCVNGRERNRRFIPRNLRRRIWNRDQGRCQFIDIETRRKCESKYALEIDHAVPVALGGPTKEENLRLLCRAHNLFKAEEVFGKTGAKTF